MKYNLLLAIAIPAILCAQTTVGGRTSVGGGIVIGQATAAPFTVTVSGVNSTRAVLSYTCGTAATVEVSESATYLPLVHDVDTALFGAGANLDSRATSANNGTAHVFVAGARTSALAADTKKYSRALQANTPHYARVNCGGSIGTATFTTANIPVGSSLNEPPPADPATPGGWLLPTLDPTSRTQTIIDQQTGAQLSPVSLQSDKRSAFDSGMNIYTGAPPRSCNSALHTDGSGNQGHLCNLYNDGFIGLYFFVPATNESRFLGIVHPANMTVNDDLSAYIGDDPTQLIDSSTSLVVATGSVTFGQGDSAPWLVGMRVRAYSNADPTKFMEGLVTSYVGSMHQMVMNVDTTGGLGSGPYTDWKLVSVGNIYQYTYTGNYVAACGSCPVSLSSPPVIISVPSGNVLMHNFDPTFDVAHFGCGMVYATAGNYAPVVCKSGSQDSYGWLGSFYGGDGRQPVPNSCTMGDTECPRVVTAWNTYYRQDSKFCGIHETNMLSSGNILAVTWHGLSTNPGDDTVTQVGIAPIITYVASTSSGATMTVTGAPASNAPADTYPAPSVSAGDRFRIVGGNATVYTVSSRSGNVWTVSPSITVSAGDKVIMNCNALPDFNSGLWSQFYYGISDITGATVIQDRYFPPSHADSGPLGRVTEASAGWGFVLKGAGTLLASLNTPMTLIDSSASWNGVTVPGFGNLLAKHPSYQQTTNAPWFLDRTAFDGGSTAGGSPGGGRFYSADTGAVFVSGSLYKYVSDSAYPLQRKLVPTQSTSGGYSLRDISGPSSLITNGAGSNFQYCVVYKNGECFGGSTVGEIYFNLPYGPVPYCSGGDAPNPSVLDICITNMPAYAGGLMQMYMGTDNADSQSKSRNLTGGAVGPKSIFVYPLAKAIADGSYALFTIGTVISSVGTIDVWKVKIPPLPAPDGINRTGYISTPITVAAGAQNNVLVSFGYTEDGGNCGSRGDPCYATAATVPAGADPYAYAVDGSSGTLATLTGLPCASGCTVAVPATTGRVLYSRIIYRDASNNILSTGPTQVTVIQ